MRYQLPCFLCEENMPVSKGQIAYKGLKGERVDGIIGWEWARYLEMGKSQP